MVADNYVRSMSTTILILKELTNLTLSQNTFICSATGTATVRISKDKLQQQHLQWIKF